MAKAKGEAPEPATRQDIEAAFGDYVRAQIVAGTNPEVLAESASKRTGMTVRAADLVEWYKSTPPSGVVPSVPDVPDDGDHEGHTEPSDTDRMEADVTRAEAASYEAATADDGPPDTENPVEGIDTPADSR